MSTRIGLLVFVLLSVAGHALSDSLQANTKKPLHIPAVARASSLSKPVDSVLHSNVPSRNLATQQGSAQPLLRSSLPAQVASATTPTQLSLPSRHQTPEAAVDSDPTHWPIISFAASKKSGGKKSGARLSEKDKKLKAKKAAEESSKVKKKQVQEEKKKKVDKAEAAKKKAHRAEESAKAKELKDKEALKQAKEEAEKSKARADEEAASALEIIEKEDEEAVELAGEVDMAAEAVFEEAKQLLTPTESTQSESTAKTESATSISSIDHHNESSSEEAPEAPSEHPIENTEGPDLEESAQGPLTTTESSGNESSESVNASTDTAEKTENESSEKAEKSESVDSDETSNSTVGTDPLAPAKSGSEATESSATPDKPPPSSESPESTESASKPSEHAETPAAPAEPKHEAPESPKLPEPIEAEPAGAEPSAPPETSPTPGPSEPETPAPEPSEPETPAPGPSEPETPVPVAPEPAPAPVVPAPAPPPRAPVAKLASSAADECSVTLTLDENVVLATSEYQLYLQWASAPWPTSDSDMVQKEHPAFTLTSPNKEGIFHWLLCDAHRPMVDTGLVPGVTYYFRTAYCQKESGFGCGEATPTEPQKLGSQGSKIVPESHPRDFGIRVHATLHPGQLASSLRELLEMKLHLPEGRILQNTMKSSVLLDIIPDRSATASTPAQIADQIRLETSLVHVDSMSLIRRCPGEEGDKFQEDCEAPSTVLLSSDNIVYMGLLTLISVAGCYYVRNRKSTSADQDDKHGRFSAVGEDDELELQSFGGSAETKKKANAGPDSVALAAKDFRTIDVEGVQPDTVPGDSETGSAQALMRRVLSNMGIPEVGMKRYLGILDDKWISRVDQLRGYDSNDWKRLGVPEIIEQALREELRNSKAAQTAPKSSVSTSARGLSLKKTPQPLAAKQAAAANSSNTSTSASPTKPTSTDSILQSLDTITTHKPGAKSKPAVSSSTEKGDKKKTGKGKPGIMAVSITPLADRSDSFGDDDFGGSSTNATSAATKASPPKSSIAITVKKTASPLVSSEKQAAEEWPTLALDSTKPTGSGKTDDNDVDLTAWNSLDDELDFIDR